MREVWCQVCQAYRPPMEEPPHSDDLNPYPWYDLLCGWCHFVIATFRIRPDESGVVAGVEAHPTVADAPIRTQNQPYTGSEPADS